MVEHNSTQRVKNALEYWEQIELLEGEVSLRQKDGDESGNGECRIVQTLDLEAAEEGENLLDLVEKCVRKYDAKGYREKYEKRRVFWCAWYWGALPVSEIGARLISETWDEDNEGFEVRSSRVPLFEIVCNGEKVVKAGPSFSAWLYKEYLVKGRKKPPTVRDYKQCCEAYREDLLDAFGGMPLAEDMRAWAERSAERFFGENGKETWRKNGCEFGCAQLFVCFSDKRTLLWGPTRQSFYLKDMHRVCNGIDDVPDDPRPGRKGILHAACACLQALRSAVTGKDQSGRFDLLRCYVEGGFRDDVREEARFDILSADTDEESLLRWYSEVLFCGRTPLGRWPSRWQPSLMQQTAVNLVAGRAAAPRAPQRKKGSENLEIDKVFSVNGPPGTGKTTLLKDIVASFVVERAWLLSEYKNPDEAFVEASFEGEVASKGRVYRLVDDAINDFGILVCSSNNAAVENISKELPLVEGILAGLPDLDGDPADALEAERRSIENLQYFNEAADGQFGEVGGKKLLLSARLGRKRNVDAFCDALSAVCDDLDNSGDRGAYENARARFREAYDRVRDALENHEARGNAFAAYDRGPAGFVEDLTGRNPDARCRAQTFNPSSCWEIDRRRDELFILAIEFMREFIRSSKRLRSNYKNLRMLLRGEFRGNGIDAGFYKRHTAELIQTLFLLTPVVSSTFASVGTLFENVSLEGDLGEKAPFGLLVVDEAGQASPQMAVGACARCRRAVVVGDPKQVAPVITSELDVLKHRWKHVVNEEFLVKEPSVQKFADNRNRFGSMLPSADAEDEWLGCPLLVHRRCLSPMFDISNEISYGKKMVQGTPDEKLSLNEQGKLDVPYCLPASCWINVAGRRDSGHYVRSQGVKAFELIRASFVKNGTLPDLFVISPFKSVAEGFRSDLRTWIKRDELSIATGLASLDESELKSYLDRNVGTVHTFQGKEADEVIFLLGCDRYSSGSVRWVSKNIVNVAASRAKKRLYVIGDIEAWVENPYVRTMRNILDRQWVVEYEKVKRIQRELGSDCAAAQDLTEELRSAQRRFFACLPSEEKYDEFDLPICADGLCDAGTDLAWDCEKFGMDKDFWSEERARARFGSIDEEYLRCVCNLVKQGLMMIDASFWEEREVMYDMSPLLLSFHKASEIVLREGYLPCLRTARGESERADKSSRHSNPQHLGIGGISREMEGNTFLLGELTKDERDEAWWKEFVRMISKLGADRNTSCHGSSDRIDGEKYEQALQRFFAEGDGCKPAGLLREERALPLLCAAVSDNEKLHAARAAEREWQRARRHENSRHPVATCSPKSEDGISISAVLRELKKEMPDSAVLASLAAAEVNKELAKRGYLKGKPRQWVPTERAECEMTAFVTCYDDKSSSVKYRSAEAVRKVLSEIYDLQIPSCRPPM